MFNPLTRTLKLGLTAITILTAGVGVAFAEVQIIDDFVERCSGTSTETGCTTAVKLCITNPFGSGCAATFGGDAETIVINNDLMFKVKNAHAVAKVRYCGSATNRVKLVCTTAQPGETTAILERPNAANWVKKNPDALDVPTRPAATVGTIWRGSFLKGSADGLNEGDATDIYSQGSLNLKTTTFNGVALGGDATDGVAFFVGSVLGSVFRGSSRPFSGIFSGTDLGAPVTELSGTASWVGRWQFGNETLAKDFVLEVDFDNQTVDAFVKEPGPYTWSFYLAGNYDDSGIIKGNFEFGYYQNNERKIETADYGVFWKWTTHVKGAVTGLIGQDGAVGAFRARGANANGMGTLVFAGGFVARPADKVAGAVVHLEKTCQANPYHEFCYTSDERLPFHIMDNCGGARRDDSPSYCTDVARNCVNNPFGAGCAAIFVGKSHAVAKARYCGNQTVPTVRANDHECHDTWGGVNAANWVTESPNAPTRPYTGTASDTNPRQSQFLKGGKSAGLYSLSLSTAIFNGVVLNGYATDGVSFFIQAANGANPYVNKSYGYAEIFSGTDLGEPITETSGKAKWVGRLKDENSSFYRSRANTDFVLEVDYASRSLNALVSGYYLDGNYSSSGIITGNFGRSSNRTDTVLTGHVTGLIGKDGAVGAFHSGSNHNSYAGGFVARPAEDVEGASLYLKNLCDDDDEHDFCFVSDARITAIVNNCNNNPFGTTASKYGRGGCAKTLGAVEYSAAKVLRITECIAGGNVISSDVCRSAQASNKCINNPFADECVTDSDFKNFHVSARTNRLNFCNITTNSRNSLCTSTEVAVAICKHKPFGTDCSDSRYDTHRLDRATFCNRNMSDDLCRGQGVTTANICSQIPFDSICNTSYDDKRLEIANRCLDNPSDRSCNDVTPANICSQLPFDSTCGITRFEYLRTERITLCNDESTPRNNRRCMLTEVVTAICDINLFGTSCLRYSNHNSVYNNKRTVRITTCNEAGGVSNPLCKPADVVTAICANNLFGTGCLRSSIHNPKRANILNSCTTNSGNSDCTDLNLNSVCSYAPFSPLCVDNDDYASKREDTFESCKNRDSDIVSCNGVRQVQAPSGKADAATWADGLITLNNPKGISSITSVDLSYDPYIAYRENPYRKSQFVEGLEVLEEGFNLRTRGKTPFTFLNLADNLVGSSTKTLGGQSEDGVAFFGLKVGYGEFPFYAGILSGTDLGAPITGITGTVAIWSGVFQAISGKDNRRVKRNFDLRVTFTDSKTGEIDAFVNSTDDNYYHLTGNFDSIGVITGTVDYGSFTDGKIKKPTGERLPGRLTGLIGEQGAVGAFIADMDDYGRGFYAGGFVARETKVNYADWAADANPLAAIGTSSGNQFLKAEETTLLDKTTRSIVLNLADATHNRIGLGGDSTDGVAFFKNPEVGFNSSYYAGVLSGTDLGLPIEPGASGDWKGSIRIVYGSGIWHAVDFNLTVTLGGTADDVNQAGIITAVANGVLEDNNNPQSLHINGKFDYSGVIIKGTVDLGGGGYATGILKGLIGQEGAVGAFISNGSSPFSGGFVARPDLVQVTSANLATLQTKPRDITNSGFLTASSAGLDIENSSLPQGHALSGQQMILRRGGADSDNPDGIAYFFTTADNGNASRSYGGILSTTNLGAPVEATQTSAIWNGYHSYRDSSNIVNERTKFYVDFAAGKFGFANDDENGIGTFVKAPFGTTPVVTFALNGLFGSQNNMAVGQLGGTLKYVFKPNSGTAATDADGFTRYNLNVHGLIGQEGAVGVYLEESVNASRVGGFVASSR